MMTGTLSSRLKQAGLQLSGKKLTHKEPKVGTQSRQVLM